MNPDARSLLPRCPSVRFAQWWGAWVVAIGLVCIRPAVATALAPVDLAGVWAGVATHEGESQPLALDIEAVDDSTATLALTFPVVHLDHLALGRVPLRVSEDSVRVGPFAFAYRESTGALTGLLPRGLAPVYSIPLTFHRTDHFESPERPGLECPAATPSWIYETGSPIWAGPSYARGLVYAGTLDGRVLALDARTGALRWSHPTGGPVRARPAIAGKDLFVQADDGFLYRLDATTGEQRWRVKIVDQPIVRLPFDDPKSRYDRFASDAVVAGGRVYVGTHAGQLLALDAADGRREWEFQAGDAVLAAPAVVGGRVLFGSYDHHVYALEARTGRLLWKRDTRGAVVSTPAVSNGIAVVGNRCYDLLGLEVLTGAVKWKQYVWMSWIESSASVRDGVAYVGSSDEAALMAVDVESGRRRWTTDVHGWSWGQPALDSRSVYAGTSGQAGYPVRHAGTVLALDRGTGTVRWRYETAPADSGAYGFPGSVASGAGRVFAAGLDGRVVALPEQD